MKDALLAVITVLKANSAVAAVVGTRIYKGTGDIPATPTKPFIACEWIDRPPETPTSSSTYINARIQCTSFETTGTKAAILSELIGDALVVESLVNAPVSGVEFSDVEDKGGTPDYTDGKLTGEYRDNHDFIVTYRTR